MGTDKGCPCFTESCGYSIRTCPYSGINWMICPYWLDWAEEQNKDPWEEERLPYDNDFDRRF